MKYQSYIGLEVHIHLLTHTKAFCSCAARFGDKPNTNVCPVCMGYPGVLPTLNREALRLGAIVAKALNCSIPENTWFERKQYFYPDMPKNYQISQFASPLGVQGWIDIPQTEVHADGDRATDSSGPGFRTRRIRIKEAHLEEDAGKMIHAGNVSLADYNRAGVPLLEIVTEPDFETGAEAEAYLHLLRRIVRYLGVCDGNMEEGSMRCDANVSINLPGKGLGNKVEIKNLNSSRFVRLGLDYEIRRQAEVLDRGGTIRQETRLWNENRDQTEVMRTKESSHDYRFFPEPDLPAFRPDASFIESVEAHLIELPLDRERRMMTDYGLESGQAALVCEERAGADWFEDTVREAVRCGMERDRAAGRVANWMATDVRRVMNRDGIELADIRSLHVTSERMAAIVTMVDAGRVSTKVARQVFDAVMEEDREPAVIVAEHGWEMVVDPEKISAAVEKTFADDAASVADAVVAMDHSNISRIKALSAFLVGKAIAASGGKAEPSLVRAEVDRRLTSLASSARQGRAGGLE